MKHDPILELEKLHFETTMDLEDLAARLGPLLRIQRVLYRAIVAAHSRKANRLLCELMQAENRPRGKGRPGARKGKKSGSP